ncbi:uncharacterized protein SETTUDRAFT_90047 [Exserohilum turcica Et28A]|uniref:Xylanolytic transcriptional activator regulatory domain-containing protein n=1 Tax=Exserohilum turcicum (strain 28A) TaxID=671987 RepID=R0IK66_EXST2|nr:uncharacterized protein SETTUDRAFT_90047 [Exserohilum turcica Et28A]EOA85505.1 hypothetical protein SETTUDRAFT_90047 [Exserohilum turcica Et28A]
MLIWRRQVQDLQSQIAELTHVNSQLRTRVADQSPMDSERTDMKRRYSQIHAGVTQIPRRVSVPVLDNFDRVRDNIREHAHGVFSTPHQDYLRTAEPDWPLPRLPLHADYAYSSRSFLDTIHGLYPALHWPTFQHKVDQVYAARTFDGCSRAWIGLFFAVLACGSLRRRSDYRVSPGMPEEGQAMFDTASSALQPWPQHLTMVHAQAALLMSIFATESNQRSLGSIWLASAVRIVHELQISPELDCWSAFDAEVRRRLWWSVYVRDRMVSLETNRPMLINENDCELSLPTSVDDRYIQPNEAFGPFTKATHFNDFVATIHMTRLYAPLQQALKSSTILPQTMASFDEQLRSKLLLLPEAYQPDSSAILDAKALPTVFVLLSARFHLYRRNLSPVSGAVERGNALERCVSVAQDTAKYVSRVSCNTSMLDAAKAWTENAALIASNVVCLHLWRCILILCFRGEYDAALVCLHLSRSIGSARNINAGCGRNMCFFLERLFDQVRNSVGGSKQLEQDEEMIAYLSADTQGSLEHSWVWAGSNMAPSGYRQDALPGMTRSPAGEEAMREAPLSRGPFGAGLNGSAEWDDWGRVEGLVRQLVDERLYRATQGPTYYPPPHNPVKRVQLASDTYSPPKAASEPSPAPSSTSRISIANII